MMRSEEGQPDTRAAVQAAIVDAIADEGDMVTKWVALVEGINADGERYLWRLSDSDSTSWDRLGILEFALTKARAEVACCDDEDD